MSSRILRSRQASRLGSQKELRALLLREVPKRPLNVDRRSLIEELEELIGSWSKMGELLPRIQNQANTNRRANRIAANVYAALETARSQLLRSRDYNSAELVRIGVRISRAHDERTGEITTKFVELSDYKSPGPDGNRWWTCPVSVDSFSSSLLASWSYLLDLTPQCSLTPQAAEAPVFGIAVSAGAHARS